MTHLDEFVAASIDVFGEAYAKRRSGVIIWSAGKVFVACRDTSKGVVQSCWPSRGYPKSLCDDSRGASG